MVGQQASPQALPDVRVRKLEVSYGWALTVAVIAVIALVGLAAWTAATQLNQPKGEQAVTSLVNAWTTNDAALLEDVYAPDAVVVSAGGGTYASSITRTTAGRSRACGTQASGTSGPFAGGTSGADSSMTTAG